jgi:hypothetical protein
LGKDYKKEKREYDGKRKRERIVTKDLWNGLSLSFKKITLACGKIKPK